MTVDEVLFARFAKTYYHRFPKRSPGSGRSINAGFRLAVEAFGSAEAGNEWIFSEGLPTDFDLKLLYAGDGTLWTDMKNVGVRANLDIKQPDSPNQRGE